MWTSGSRSALDVIAVRLQIEACEICGDPVARGEPAFGEIVDLIAPSLLDAVRERVRDTVAGFAQQPDARAPEAAVAEGPFEHAREAHLAHRAVQVADQPQRAGIEPGVHARSGDLLRRGDAGEPRDVTHE